MTKQKQNLLNQEYDAKMIHKFKDKIKQGNLQIGNWFQGAPEVTNLRFLEKFDIQTLNIYINNGMSVRLRNNMIKELTMLNFIDDESLHLNLNLKVDDLDLENLEILVLDGNNLENDQLLNISKFKKLHTLFVSGNNVDLTHIHSVLSLTNLTMRQCDMQNIDQIAQLVNLQVLDVSTNLLKNIDSISHSSGDSTHLFKSKLVWRKCICTYTDNFRQLILKTVCLSLCIAVFLVDNEKLLQNILILEQREITLFQYVLLRNNKFLICYRLDSTV
ncbi:Leucine-rich_repeat domain superfamily [Hexamita inflata]|uniref:Leucine-rich_repeat domain superfamily n=1 Tax=Hexamita inflata TaxID=28002 RepID=A0ABP1I895_9EUKA